MNSIRTRNKMIAAAIGAMALAALPGLAHAQVAIQRVNDGAQGLQVISTEAIAGDETGQSHSLQIRIENGKVNVIRDGKEVPEAQIKQDNGEIIILDKDGNQLQAYELRLRGEPGSIGFWRGSDANEYFQKALTLRGATETPKVMLGVHMSEPGDALEAHLGLEDGQTTMIGGIYEGLPAYDAGLRQYDIIVEVNGNTPADHETIRKILAEKNPGDTIDFSVIHEGKRKRVTVTLGA